MKNKKTSEKYLLNCKITGNNDSTLIISKVIDILKRKIITTKVFSIHSYSDFESLEIANKDYIERMNKKHDNLIILNEIKEVESTKPIIFYIAKILHERGVCFEINNGNVFIDNTDIILFPEPDSEVIIFFVSHLEEKHSDIEWENDVPCFVKYEDIYYTRNCDFENFATNIDCILPKIQLKQREAKLEQIIK